MTNALDRRLIPSALLLVLVSCHGLWAGDELPGSGRIADSRALEFVYADADADTEFILTQAQPPTASDVEEQPRTPPLASIAARRRRQTYRLPPMFGDIFGSGTYQALIQPTPILISQSIVDGQGFDLFVTNRNGGNGADVDENVVIDVRQGQGGVIIASSIGPGFPPRQASVYPIGEPFLPGISPPPPLGAGTINYLGGTASHTGTQSPVGDSENWRLDFQHQFIPNRVLVNVPIGGAVGREKIAENNSPEPRARFFWNYNFYNDVIGGVGDVNRYSLGFERPTPDGIFSIELRFPFAASLDADQFLGAPAARNTEFGDITVIGKLALWRHDEFLLSVGAGVTLPTAEDSRVFTNSQTQIMELRHESVRVLPYLAMMHGFDSGWYWQSFVQWDVAANGDPIFLDLAGANLRRVGILQEATTLFVDVGVGYWLTTDLEHGMPAVAATAELHYGGTLQDADAVVTDDLTITSVVNRYDRLHLTAGLNIELTECLSIRPAMVVPLTTNDELFDYEAMVQMNLWH